MVSGEVASKLDSGGPFQADLYSDSESNLPKVEVAGSIPVSRSIGTDSWNGVQAGLGAATNPTSPSINSASMHSKMPPNSRERNPSCC